MILNHGSDDYVKTMVAVMTVDEDDDGDDNDDDEDNAAS